MFCRTRTSRLLAVTALCGTVTLLFTSCLSLRTRIAIDDSAEDLEGRLVLEYTIDPLFFEIGVYDAGDPMPILPVGRNDFELLTARTEGLELTAYSWEETETEVSVRAELAFVNAVALEAALGQDAAALGNGKHGTLRLQLPAGMEEGTEGDLATLLEEVSPEAGLNLSFEAAVPIVAASPGTTAGNTAAFGISLVDLFRSRNTIAWEVEW